MCNEKRLEKSFTKWPLRILILFFLIWAVKSSIDLKFSSDNITKKSRRETSGERVNKTRKSKIRRNVKRKKKVGLIFASNPFSTHFCTYLSQPLITVFASKLYWLVKLIRVLSQLRLKINLLPQRWVVEWVK